MSDDPPRVSENAEQMAWSLAENYPLVVLKEAMTLSVESIECPYCFALKGERCISPINWTWQHKGDNSRKTLFTELRASGKHSFLGRCHTDRKEAKLKHDGFAKITAKVKT